MPKLAKQMYTTAKGERKLNCYVIAIPKQIAHESGFNGDEDITIKTGKDQIIIEKR